jgi:hypothetical protein
MFGVADQRRPRRAGTSIVAGATDHAKAPQSVRAFVAAVASALPQARECRVAGTRRATLALIESCAVRPVTNVIAIGTVLTQLTALRGEAAHHPPAPQRRFPFRRQRALNALNNLNGWTALKTWNVETCSNARAVAKGPLTARSSNCPRAAARCGASWCVSTTAPHERRRTRAARDVGTDCA